MDSPKWMFTKALNHKQQVLRLFKRAYRECQAWSGVNQFECRYQQVVMRQRFDQHKDEKDPIKARKLLVDGCKEIWLRRHPQPCLFSEDAWNGINFGRVAHQADWKTDQVSYIEREQYPYYYNRRELRKRELVAVWEKMEESFDKELASIQRKPPPA